MAAKNFWSTPLPALLLLVFAAAVYWALFFSDRTSIRSSRAVESPATLRLLEPLGPASYPIRFRWEAPYEARSFRLIVFEGAGRTVWEKETRAREAQLPDDVARTLEGARSYFWKVQVLDDAGRSSTESASQPLIVGR